MANFLRGVLLENYFEVSAEVVCSHGKELWKGMGLVWDFFWKLVSLLAGKRHIWCGNEMLDRAFTDTFRLPMDEEASVSHYMVCQGDDVFWNIMLRRLLQDRELD